jgi:DNA modification methylase
MELENRIYLADCFSLMDKWYRSGSREFIDLIYIDPPFNSKRDYNIIFDSKSDLSEKAFVDTWSDVSYHDELRIVSEMSPGLFSFLKMLETTNLPKSYISYLTSMSVRCWLMREMLKPTGSLYFHCDPTMSHYIKIMLDYVFGIQNFKNELIWYYPGGLKSIKSIYPRKHDIILFYTKTGNYTFNIQRKATSMEVSFWQRWGKYSLDGKTVTFGAVPDSDKVNKSRQVNKFRNQYGRNPEENDIIYELEGALVESVWDDCPAVYRSKENRGYPTQKPEALLERIIKASSNEGDLVADFYMGGGTTGAVAIKLGRKFLGTDINSRAIQITKKRLEDIGLELKKDFFIFGIPKSSAELRELVSTGQLGREKNSRFAFEDVVVKYYLPGVSGNEKKVGDGSIDGRFMFKQDGEPKIGIVQITTGAGINHFKAFCSEVGRNGNEMGVYITFEDKITASMVKIAKDFGRIGNVDKLQILTVEDLVDKGKQFEKPVDSSIFS